MTSPTDYDVSSTDREAARLVPRSRALGPARTCLIETWGCVDGCRSVGSVCACRPLGLGLVRTACRLVFIPGVWLEGGENRSTRIRSARLVRADDHARILRLLAKRHRDLGRAKNQSCGRLHALLLEMIPGGAGFRMSSITRGNTLADIRLEASAPASSKRLLALTPRSGTTRTPASPDQQGRSSPTTTEPTTPWCQSSRSRRDCTRPRRRQVVRRLSYR